MRIAQFKRRKVAITGGAGLIGSFVAAELVRAGASVVVIDDFSKGTRKNLAAVADRIEVRRGDLENQAFAAEAFGGCEIVFHLASRAYGVAYSESHHLQILQHNERITNNVLAALETIRPRHLLVTSSSCVYDDGGPDTIPELPTFHREPEIVNWGYGWAKRFLEQKSLIFSRQTGVPVTIVRPFNIYGEHYHWMGEYSQAIPMLVKRVMDGEDPVVFWGSGRQRRSYIHAIDCARMMVALVLAGHHGDPVNLGTAETISISELTERICRAGERRPTLKADPSKPEGRFIKSADMNRFFSIVPDFRFSIGLDEGLARMVKWYEATFVEGNGA